MKPTSANVRSIGVGETLRSSDFIQIGDDYVPIGREHEGHIVMGDEELEFVRPCNIYINIDEIAASYDIETEMGKAALAVAIENIQTLDKKQKDYGSNNIGAFGEYGILVRVWDKISRLKNLLTNVLMPSNESVEDSWLDLANYALIAVLVRRKIWK